MTTEVLTGEVVDPLSNDEWADRERLEKTVNDAIGSFIDIGYALAEINERRLYRSTDKTFVAYLKREWQMSESQAYRYIDAALVTGEVQAAIEAAGENSPVGEAVPPQNEAQARELVKLKGRPEDAAAAMAAASEDGPPTAKKVKEAVAGILKTPRTPPRDRAERPSLSAREQSIADRAVRLSQEVEGLDPAPVPAHVVKRLEMWCIKWREVHT